MSSAQTIRAILFASATVTNMRGLRASICSSQEPFGAPRSFACCTTALLPMLDLFAGLNRKIADLDKEIARRVREDDVSRRLMTVPGIGPISATAIVALAPPFETFAKGRDFAAWLGLTPLQRSTGGTQKLGATPKMGERTLRRLLIRSGIKYTKTSNISSARSRS